MRILFLVYHGFSEYSGISKKIHSQVKGLQENGHDVRLCYYDFSKEGHRCRYVDGEMIHDYGTGCFAAIKQRVSYNCIYKYCCQENIQLVYARCFQNASPWLIRLFKKLKEVGIYTVTEIPTYPYDQEYRNFERKMLLGLRIDQMFRHGLYRQMDALVTFSDAEEIFGQRTIRISNGVDFDSIPLILPHSSCSALHLIGVAEVHPWHAFDRVIAGLGEYKGHRPVIFHIVGGVHPDHMRHVFKPLIEKYHLEDKVVFHGALFGQQLDDMFNRCHFAIGSLGRHRSGITVIKTLKNREYATRGIPFIYSEQDSDFDHQPYVLKAPADESPIDIQQIIDFIDRFSMKPEDIRKTVEHLTWKIQMQRVIDVFQQRKIVFLTPALYMAGGVERVLTLKANYFAEHFGYDVTIILTEGKGKPFAYPLSEKIRVIHLDINFEELWTCSFVRKIVVYLCKQREYKSKLTKELMRLRPDITDSFLRREINFITGLKDGSRKIGEMHINRANYRNFNMEQTGFCKQLFAKLWSHNLVSHLGKLDRLVVLTEKDREAWADLDNVVCIPDPLSLNPQTVRRSPLTSWRVVAVARYSHEKGIDLLLRSWAEVERRVDGWRLDVYGDGDRSPYEQEIDTLHLDRSRCELHGRTDDVEKEYCASSIFVLSSRFEGFGMVITEAMACGLPVVAFDCPWGPRSIITDGEDGFLVENGNTAVLAEQLSVLMGNEDLRRQMSQCAMRNVRRFRMEEIAQQWKQLFESLWHTK